MDQTTPNYPGYIEGASYSNIGMGDYFPYHENEYELPPGQYIPQNNYVYPDNTHSTLPDSPPEYSPGHRAFPRYMQMEHSPSSLASSYPLSSSAGSGSSTNSIPIPFKNEPVNVIHHPSYAGGGGKRMRGSSSSTSTSSPLSLKQEDDVDFPFVAAGTGPMGVGINCPRAPPGQFYQEPPFSDSSDASHRNIAFSLIFRDQWCAAVAVQPDGKPSVPVSISAKVQADKGFNFSQPEDAFICQKKNHFQVTVQLSISSVPEYALVVSPIGTAEYHKITSFYLDLFGVKAEAMQQTVKIDQSQSDRSRKEFKAYHIPSLNLQQQIVIGRLHFVETTANNMRKKGKQNPDQRFFKLVVGVYAEAIDPRTGEKNRHLLYSMGSENIVVRASNPGQFEQETAPQPAWQRSSQDDEAVYHMGRIGINTDRPEEALDVRGNMRLTGRMVQPSDRRVKDILGDADPTKQLENIRKLRIVRYKYKDQVVAAFNLTESSRYDTGIIAQELMETIPEAVEIVGDLDLEDGDVVRDFLMVDKDRLYMEGLGAVQALSVLADDYGNRLTELERRCIRRVAHLKSRDSFRSNISAATAATIYSASLPYGNSVSARPSVHNIPAAQRPRAPTTPEKPGSFSPKVLLGRNYLQWMILGLVLVVAICLLAILGIYISSSTNKDGDLVEQFPSSEAVVVGTSVAPLWSTDVPGDGDNDNGPNKPPPVSVSIPPVIVVTNKPQTLLDELFPDGPCNSFPPIAIDHECVKDPIYAEKKCKTSDTIAMCCRSTMSGWGQTPQDNLAAVPEAAHFPEYRTANRASMRDLLISFDLDKTDEMKNDKTTDATDNMIPREIDNGQAVVYEPTRIEPDERSRIREANKAAKCDDPPPSTIVDSGDFKWQKLEQIYLSEPKMILDAKHCFRKHNVCGYEKKYQIPLPISKYYDRSHLDIVIRGEPNTEIAVCSFRVMEENCFRYIMNAPMHVYHTEDNVVTLQVPIGSFAHSQIHIRVADRQPLNPTRLCDRTGKDFFTYDIISGRSCR